MQLLTYVINRLELLISLLITFNASLYVLKWVIGVQIQTKDEVDANSSV